MPRRDRFPYGLRALAIASAAIANACATDPPAPAPLAWAETLHPPGPPGGSITNTQQCECRACDPASCCSAEQTDGAHDTSDECNSSYTFSEKCGIKVQTCTPRCYSHVWRIGKRESCRAARPLVCCD
ncbi:MAG TPA: hypothetical protein VEQ59_13665 [Polyangiaceae bacterium]|nr:hypothetical protein [Polyangiaceae bacterium]